MQSGAELPAAPSPFWALVALLRLEPGMAWLPCGPHGRTASCGTRAPEAGGGEGAGRKRNLVPEKHSLGPWPLEALLLLEDSRESHLWQVYLEGLKNFISFREGMALSAVWPIPVEQIREFLVAMESQGLPPTKTIMYMEGLSFISRMGPVALAQAPLPTWATDILRRPAFYTPHPQPSPAKPSQAQPSPAQPSQAQPSQAKPSQAKPSQAQPSPAQPSQAQPSQAKPSQAKPSQAQPSQAKPSQAKEWC
ncbi:hypothetical protein DUI87_09256 [Hirundo rustica rustica]|uniref:Uncharacterized protein n=1 Tax=Hirundo rustica rustica TaxID=333673 RepID=A0A3M0KM61_HIRRU|nr:hypothetical protein DUI87_09256 [Hirundo rustica rustica]